jgi:hypothetical protein
VSVTREQLGQWVTDHGFDPAHVQQAVIRIAADRVPRVELTVYDVDSEGRKYVPRGCTGVDRPEVEHLGCMAVTYRVSVPLRSWPPLDTQGEQARSVPADAGGF